MDGRHKVDKGLDAPVHLWQTGAYCRTNVVCIGLPGDMCVGREQLMVSGPEVSHWVFEDDGTPQTDV